MNIGESLRRIRFEKNMKQTDVAAKAKITQTYLSQLEKGRKEPSQSVIAKLSKVYNVPAGVIMFYAMEEKDVQKNKLEHFRKLKPVIDELIKGFLTYHQ